MTMQEFRQRLIRLQVDSDQSARKVSLGLRHGPGYYARLERGESAPPMETFFEICAFFHISPFQFFQEVPFEHDPLASLYPALRSLNKEDLEEILYLVNVWGNR